MTPKAQTIETYNKSAEALAEKFNSSGARVSDIEYVFSYLNKENPFVLEIGCGNGRDAIEISKHTNNYVGMDVSQGLLDIAKQNSPSLTFKQGDVENFEFPQEIDIVFAFASVIHIPKESLKEVMKKLFSSVTNNGLVFLSLKHSLEYDEKTTEDEFGVRTYWYYSQEDSLE